MAKPTLGFAGLFAALSLFASSAEAGKVPFSFDPSLGANPTRTQQKLASLEGKLPSTFALPNDLVTLPAGAVQVMLLPESAAALQRAGASNANTTMVWPAGTPALCAKHDAFAVPADLLVANPSPQCTAADTAVRQKLASSTTCHDVEQPERYVLSYAPAVVNDTTTGSIESLIGLAGEALSHYPTPDGLLPADWVPTLRSVLWKIRKPAIAAQIATARANYKDALSTLSSQSSCFDATALASLTSAVNALDAELDAANAHLAQVESTGTAKASQELVCLGARGRSRNTLPFPSLTADERRFVAFWLGGVYWRMRGGGLIPLDGTQKARTYFLERPFRAIGDLAGAADGTDSGEKIFLNIFAGWGDWMDMGTTPGGQDYYEDLVQMTDRGRQQVADPPTAAIGIPIQLGGLDSPASALVAKGYDVTSLITGGLMMGPCYAYAVNNLGSFRYADTPMAPYNGVLIETFTAVGEFCSGAAIALGMTDTLLEGKSTGAPPVSACQGKQCGDDGCGGSCGTCASGKSCKDGMCVGACTPSCNGKSCGDDGCGGSCGTCASGTCSSAGQCGADGSSKNATPPSDGTTSDASSGGCAFATTSSSDASLALAGGALAFAFVRRRRRR